MKIWQKCFFVVALCFFSLPLPALAGPLQLYAAGSLKAALTDLASFHEKIYGTPVSTKFGPSGLLTKAIEEGEKPDVFASANMEHPEKLASAGWGGPVVLFARNRLCALAQEDVAVTTDSFLDVLLAKNVRVGTSTPKADPSGDYAWELFKKAEAVRTGSFAILSGKALKLTGGPDSPKAPEGLNPYGWVMSEKRADVFLTYCTNAVLAQREVPGLKVIRIPEALSVGADYGLLVREGASAEAWRLAMYIVSPAGQKILKDHGFEAPAMPKEE